MKILNVLIILILGLQFAVSQESFNTQPQDAGKPEYKYSIFSTYLTLTNFGNPEINTQHYELRLGYQATPKDQFAIKLATWKLFAPLGIDLWDPAFLDREFFYPGRLRESGIGVTYQRKLWKGLFATLEVMPMITTFLDEGGKKVGSGFKLYNSYHIGYHIPLFKKGRFYIEPQMHVNHWPINTNVHEDFKVEEDRWDNVNLIEPNIYFGVKF